MDIATIIIFKTSFTTTTPTNKCIVINIDLNVRDEGADESQEQQMKYVPGRGLRVVLNKAVVAAANTIDKIKLTEDKTQAMRSAQNRRRLAPMDCKAWRVMRDVYVAMNDVWIKT